MILPALLERHDQLQTGMRRVASDLTDGSSWGRSRRAAEGVEGRLGEGRYRPGVVNPDD